MKNFLPHTDLTNPERYYDMMNRNVVLVEKPYDKLDCGLIHTTLWGFEIHFYENGKYFLEDKYGNSIYLAQWSNRMKMFDLLRENSFQFCKTLEDFELKIKSFFKRKIK